MTGLVTTSGYRLLVYPVLCDCNGQVNMIMHAQKQVVFIYVSEDVACHEQSYCKGGSKGGDFGG